VVRRVRPAPHADADRSAAADRHVRRDPREPVRRRRGGILPRSVHSAVQRDRPAGDLTPRRMERRGTSDRRAARRFVRTRRGLDPRCGAARASLRLDRTARAGLCMTEELDRLAAIMRRFADNELQGSSPLYERLARAAAADPTLLEPLLAAPKSQQRATLYFAAIHSLVLRGQGEDLAAFFPDIAESPSRDDPVPPLRTFLKERRDDLEALYATHNTQTNEVGRCAFLLPMFGLVAARARRPLAMIEAGASAGLNLLFDRYRYDYGAAGSLGDPGSTVVLRPEIRGEARPPGPRVLAARASRVGVDL